MSIPQAFKSYDIRGRYPEDIDEQFSEKIGCSIAALAGETIVVGSDNNISSPSLKEALIRGILSCGTDVIDVGIGPTDMIAYAGMTKGAPSVMVTASHLGTGHNGFKFMYREGNSFTNVDLAKLKETFTAKSYRQGERRGHLTHDTDAQREYLEHAKKAFMKYFKKIDAKIIIDTGDGACSLTTPLLLQELGAETIKINSDIRGSFRRHSDCSEEKKIAYLKDEIKRHGADLAIAHDLDGDRLAAFDSIGKWVSGDVMFSVFAGIIAKKDDTVIASVDTSALLEETTKSKIIYTRVGDPFILKAALENSAVLTGEPNGHFSLPSFVPYNSGTLFALLLAACAKKLPGMMSALPLYSSSKEKIEVHDSESKIRKIREYAESRHTIISVIDGIKYRDTDDGSTVLVRPSGTENAIRIMVERRGSTEGKIEEIKKIMGL